MRRRVALAALGFAGVAAAAPSPRLRAQPSEKVRVAGPPTEDLTSFYYALKSGALARAALDFELVPTSSGAAATTAVIAGTYEIAKTSLIAVFTAHLRGIPVVIVGPELVYTSRNAFALLQVANDSALRGGADLNGKVVGVPALGDLNQLATRAWVDKNGGDSKTLKFVEVPNAAMVPALQQHRIDAAMLQSPQLDASLADRSTRTLGDGYGAIAPNFYLGCFIARSDWVAKNGDLLRRFNRVMAEASTYVNTHPSETTPLVAELTKINLANIEKMHRSLIGTTLESGLVQPLIDAAAKYELISRAFPAREVVWNP
jgi:NitT/TauT family transport system substrate-binding protein